MKKEAAEKIAEVKEEATKQAHPEAAKAAVPTKDETHKVASDALEHAAPEDAKKPAATAKPAKAAAPAKAPVKKPVVVKKEEGATHEAKVINHDDAKELHKIAAVHPAAAKPEAKKAAAPKAPVEKKAATPAPAKPAHEAPEAKKAVAAKPEETHAAKH